MVKMVVSCVNCKCTKMVRTSRIENEKGVQLVYFCRDCEKEILIEYSN